MIYDLQKASMWKRASAFLFDFIIFMVVAVGVATLLSSLLGYDTHYNTFQAGYDKYEKEYGVDLNITQSQYEAKTEAEKKLWDTAFAAFQKDPDVTYAWGMIVNLSFVIIIFAALLAFIILEFTVPNIFGNGQTLGKKIFGIGVMRTDGIKVVPALMFIRTVLGKFTIETMIPLFLVLMILFMNIGIVGTMIIGLILLVQVILLITTQTNSMIHDVLAKTVVVDVASQMIFENEEELIAYKEKVHAEKVARQTY